MVAKERQVRADQFHLGPCVLACCPGLCRPLFRGNVLFPEAGLTRALVSTKRLVGGWDDIWPRLAGMFYYFCLLMGVSMVVRFLLPTLFVHLEEDGDGPQTHRFLH
jgi:hypothetical protein